MAKRRSTKKPAKRKAQRSPPSRRCGLCGKTGQLTRTECCGEWICNDEDKYALFSYARNSCHRNHRRLTLCGSHHVEEHEGRWQECRECREQFETELYVYYGTNEYNFEKLPSPPKYRPAKCSRCKAVIHLSEGGYCRMPSGEYLCSDCTAGEFPGALGY